jgi:hypothetical protein
MNRVEPEEEIRGESIEDASSPDQVALVWTGEDEVLVASPARSGNSYKIDLIRLPADFRLLTAIKDRRKAIGGLPKISEDTIFLTAAPEFSERTRVLSLPDEVLHLPEDDLFDWLLDAEREMVRGKDQHPVFETPLTDTACSVLRIPNGMITMTEVPRQHVNAATGRILQTVSQGFTDLYANVVETPLRCVIRYYLMAIPAGVSAASKTAKGEVTAFLMIGREGFSYGLWSPASGLFNEYAFLAPIDQSSSGNGEKETDSGAPVEAYIRNAFDQLYLQLTTEKLSQMGLDRFSNVVWACESNFNKVVAPIAADYAKKAGIEFAKLDASPNDAIAGGLLFGSFGFGRSTARGAEVLPQVNLAHDLLVQFDEEQTERRRIEDAIQKKRRAAAAFAMLIGPIIVLAVVLALVAGLLRSQVTLAVRDTLAEKKTVELKPALLRRKSYEANLNWYKGFVTQVSELRRQQPVGIGLQYDLDSRYPFAIDPTFFVSELKLQPTGEVEIKGLAKNKDAVTSFLRSLEFAGGRTSGSKLFENLTYEVQEGVAQTIDSRSTQATLPTIEGSALSGTKLAPGVIGWSIKGRYMPMVEFAPIGPADGKKTPGMPPAPATAAPQPKAPPAASK